MDFTRLTMLQIAHPGVMQVVVLLHHLERGKGEGRQDMPGHFILRAGFKQRMMAAVMLQDIQTHG